MTNEEAINYFKRSYASGDTDDERQHNEALDMAIRALKQTDKDIEQYKADLQADYEAKSRETYDCGYDCGYNCGYADAMNDISDREE